MNYKDLLKPYKEEMLKTLTEFCAINSVYDKNTVTKEMPFGKGVNNALQFVGLLGEKNGFKVDYCDGYATELTYGDGEKLISIFAHSDVVPVSGNWTNDPFELTVRDGKMFARGSSDDKGPFISAFFAAKALIDAGLVKNYRIRLVTGGDEERGSSCLEYYFHNLKKEDPTYGFTPDADFPLIYGEKGITDFFPRLNVVIPGVKSIHGGVVTNAVCDNVKVVMDRDNKFIAYLNGKRVKFSVDNDGLTFFGKTCHGSTPELGINAALICLECLGDFYDIPKIKNIGVKLSDTTGRSFGLFRSTKLMHDSTYCVGKIDYENNELVFSVNFRYPENVDAKEIINEFNLTFETQCEFIGESPILLKDPESFLVKTLMEAYFEETKDPSQPMTIGGGTYAKHAKNILAFGALFPGKAYTMHQADEYMELEDFYKSAEIYAHAIDLLGTRNEN